ncbi:hypothetical protein D3C83_197520 [compost metagenome]
MRVERHRFYRTLRGRIGGAKHADTAVFGVDVLEPNRTKHRVGRQFIGRDRK